MTRAILNPQRFDALVTKPRGQRPERPVWTLGAIGDLIGVGPDFVRSLAAEPGSPIHAIGGRWYCYPSELDAWMRKSNRLDSPQTL